MSDIQQRETITYPPLNLSLSTKFVTFKEPFEEEVRTRETTVLPLKV